MSSLETSVLLWVNVEEEIKKAYGDWKARMDMLLKINSATLRGSRTHTFHHNHEK